MRLDCIYRLLEITKRERHHELLLSVKNLQDLGATPFPYIVPVLSRPLPNEVDKGEHFVLAYLLRSLQRGSMEPLVQPDHLPLAVQDPKPVPRWQKEKRKRRPDKRSCQHGIGGVHGLDESES